MIPLATMRELNDAAHHAARQARKLKDPRAAELTRIARDTDKLMDNINATAKGDA